MGIFDIIRECSPQRGHVDIGVGRNFKGKGPVDIAVEVEPDLEEIAAPRPAIGAIGPVMLPLIKTGGEWRNIARA